MEGDSEGKQPGKKWTQQRLETFRGLLDRFVAAGWADWHAQANGQIAISWTPEGRRKAKSLLKLLTALETRDSEDDPLSRWEILALTILLRRLL